MVKNNNQLNYYDTYIVGTDEVGVGDVFGPLVVSSCFIEEFNLNEIKKMGIKDSKKISDNKILELAPQLMKLVKYKTMVFNNCEYNKIYEEYKNSHILKALGHNKVIWEILEGNKDIIKSIYIDQFVNEKKYFEYLNGRKNVVSKNVHFVTKGESKLASIAISSIISRYIFLNAMKDLASKYNLEKLPLGCSNETKLVAQKYQKKQDLYPEIAKTHFNIKIKN